MKIAVIEDEKPIREGLVHILNKISPEYQVVGSAENGVEGLILLEEEMPEKGAVLLCSDGLSNYLDQEDLHRLIWDSDAFSAVNQLIGQANAMGGADNITAVLIAR